MPDIRKFIQMETFRIFLFKISSNEGEIENSKILSPNSNINTNIRRLFSQQSLRDVSL